MDNIIQSISQKVKGEIKKDVIKVLEGGLNLDNIVDSVGIMVNDIAQITLSTIINEINEFVKESPERSKNYHVQRNNDKRTLITRFGELKFERTYYKDIINNSYIYILDELLGIEKYERVEANLRCEKNREKATLELDERVINNVKRTYNTTDPDMMIDLPYISKTQGRWLKDMLRSSSF